MKIRVHIIVSGEVQGVGFRFFTRNLASRLDINGFVRNLPDGTVETEAEGEEGRIRQFIELLRRGPAAGYVSALDVREISGEAAFDRFEIRF
ncbi:MAG: acylphosphatase [Candidatus Krumholzibacteriota bacterium]|nr:acylphosphatase [Candidatus Krumholzibacteriota bacterium]